MCLSIVNKGSITNDVTPLHIITNIINKFHISNYNTNRTPNLPAIFCYKCSNSSNILGMFYMHLIISSTLLTVTNNITHFPYPKSTSALNLFLEKSFFLCSMIITIYIFLLPSIFLLNNSKSKKTFFLEEKIFTVVFLVLFLV